jgi:hypothetical protein
MKTEETQFELEGWYVQSKHEVPSDLAFLCALDKFFRQFFSLFEENISRGDKELEDRL